ncbi:MAG TPA: hypothetical protein VKY40_07560 [Halanaerobiales bacterium]|nr:hypothetical protein [Halanaerobiales bacterium]
MLAAKKTAKNRVIFDILFGLGIALLLLGVFLFLQRQGMANRVESMTDSDNIAAPAENRPYSHLIFEQLSIQEEEEIELEIPVGISGIMVAELLEEKGLIKAEDFHTLMLLFDIERRLKAGKYRFSENDSPVDVLEKILVK